MKPYTDRNIKSTTQVSLPFGTMIFTHGYWQRRNQTTYQYSFDEWFDADQMQPTNWRHLGNRKDVRDLMISEGKATPGEADAYIKILTQKQWAFRKGNHSMTILLSNSGPVEL